MSRRRKVLIAIAALGVIVLGTSALIIRPLFTGSALPAGATLLHITTQRPNLTVGSMTALLGPVRVATTGDELVLVSAASGDTVRVAWPSGFAAWRVGGHSVVADPWGKIVGRDGDVLQGLSGGFGTDDVFVICPFGIPTEG
jgi:ABC-type amino acid transport substrate-binding protein